MTYCVSDFIDHYVLDSLRYLADPKNPNKPVNEMSPAVTKYRLDLEQYWQRHILGFSTSLRDYLFMSACGEAQYANTKAKRYVLDLPTYGMHEAAYKHCVQYAPSSWIELARVFDHSWGGSYGGEKWFNITKHAADWQAHLVAKELGKWIDHAADLEHNSKGGLFNKATPTEVLRRDLSKSAINEFLDWKFESKSVALSIPSSKWCQYTRPPVRMLVERYLILWKGQTTKPVWAYPIEDYKMSAPAVSPIKWGDTAIVIIDKHPTTKSTSIKKKGLAYNEKAVSNGVVLDPYQYGGIPAHLLPIVGQLWMYAIANDGKEVETDGS